MRDQITDSGSESQLAALLCLLAVLLRGMCRCCNPAACRHDPKQLAELHPNSQKKNQLTWDNYYTQLCDYKEGYGGVLCGKCMRPGFGMTAPFKCSRCIGSTYLPDGSVAGQAGRPSRAGISMLYLAYWVPLTCWMLFTVRFSVLLPGQKHQAHITSLTMRGADAAVARPPSEKAQPAGKASGQADGLQDTSTRQLHDQHSTPATADTGGAVHLEHSTTKENSKSLDITKVRLDCCSVGPCRLLFNKRQVATAVAGPVSILRRHVYSAAK
jgi:hypothetical protein